MLLSFMHYRIFSTINQTYIMINQTYITINLVFS